jgi:hypothetical protein
LRAFPSWLLKLQVVTLAVAALCAAIGFIVSRRSLPGPYYQSLATHED